MHSTTPSQAPPGNSSPLRSLARNLVKALLTIGAFYLLLAHHVTDENGETATTFAVIRRFLPGIDLGVFLRFVVLAALVKFIGILSSMYRWQLLLEGQGIELPFRHIFGSFLIGRFLGTFLPSTIGLDGYKLYDAARFSGRSVEVSAATLVEKVIGPSGIFLSYLVALPFGISIFGERAEQIAFLTVPIALVPIAVMFAFFLWPGPRLIRWLIDRVRVPAYQGFLRRLSDAATAYGDKPRIVAGTIGLSFLVHFTTAALYFFTALAIGVTTAQASFWQVTFASCIQILATVLSPFTIAGEGIREIAQYYLLGHLMGPAESIVSAALGFWAAEGLTLFGGIVWWARRADYTPAWCRVDGRQVDYREAAREARELGLGPESDERGVPVAVPLAERLLRGASGGLLGGLVAGIVLGLADAAVTLALAGPGEDTQVVWYAVALYGAVLGSIGLATGAALAVLPLGRATVDRWAPTLALIAALFPLGLATSLFRLQRDMYGEQRPPLGVMLLALAAIGVVTLVLAAAIAWALRPRAGRSRRVLSSAAIGVAAWFVLLSIAGVASFRMRPAPHPARTVRAAIPEELRDRPNVLLVIVDTLRADHLGVYGDQRNLTPNIDAFARDAVAFHAFGQSSWTKPSIATIMTSLYASSHGAMAKPAVLPESATTLAQTMRTAGYTTAGFVSNVNLAPSFGFDRGFDDYDYLAPDYLLGAEESSSKLVLYSILRKVILTVNKKRWVNQYYQDSRTVNAAVLPWLERNRDDRFFLLVHYMDPHDPYFHHPYDGEAIARVENPNPSPTLAAKMRELYAGEVHYMDESFGALVAFLRREGLYDDMAIVLVADHGEEFQEHGGWWHGTTLYDEQIRIPMLIKLPAKLSRLTPAPGQARLLDVAPTIAGIAGVSPPTAWQGADLRPGFAADRPVFAEEDFEGNVLSAVRTPQQKLIRANPGNPRGLKPEELYDVAADPHEKQDLAPTAPGDVTQLSGLLGDLSKVASGEAVADRAEVKMDSATKERLRALGYVQ